MPKVLDPFWEYGEPDGGTNRAYLTCKLCETKMTGGVTRLKYHLARITGHDVGICTVFSSELIQKALEAIDEKDRKKEETERNKAECAGRSFGISSPDFDAEGGGRGFTTSPTTASARSSFFVPRTRHGSQPGIKSLVKKKEKQEAYRVMGRCLFWSDLPLSITKTNPFWQPMCDAIAVVGPRYKSATYEELRGPILQAEKQGMNSRLAELKKTWEVTGCIVMSDGWIDRKGRTLLNFLVHCPKGTMFIKSVDASEHIKEATTICELLDGFIREIGVQNVVQVITNNAANYVSTGKMLMERHHTLFWTPCATHCLDLLLEDMGKLSFIKEAVDMARSVPKFIYNHAFVLSPMRKFTRHKKLQRPAITRFATNFITLQSLLRCQCKLKQMFVFDDWRNCRYSRRQDGKAIAKMVYSEMFWRGVEEACSVSEPIVKVLRLVDGEKPAMTYLYEAMDRAKEAIRSYYADKGSASIDRHMMLWDVIDSRWTGMLHRPIHAATLFLNPAFSYKCGFDFDGEQIEAPMYLDVISLDNIDVLSQWRVESEEPILEESPSCLEPDDPFEHGQQEEGDKEEEEGGHGGGGGGHCGSININTICYRYRRAQLLT
eukprot:PITA_09492